MSVAIVEAFSTAMQGRSKERQELAERSIPLEARIPVLRSRSGDQIIRELFEPLGYQVSTQPIPLDEEFPEWGQSPYFELSLAGTVRLCDLLRHLYILLPVLDSAKHYYMDGTEVNKLLSKGQGWLASHPKKDWIVRSYLGRKPSLEREAIEQLANLEESLLVEAVETEEALAGLSETHSEPSEVVEPKVSLHRIRHDRVIEVVRSLKPTSVVDLGCGEGKLIRQLSRIAGLDRIVGMDVSYYELEKAQGPPPI